MKLRGALVILAVACAPALASPPFGGGRPPVFAQRWDELTTEQKSRAMENYQRYKSLPPEKQRNLEERYERWKNLPAADKDRYRRKLRDSDRD